MAAIDLDALWNYGEPAQSEARFQQALTGASPTDALILQTQIARTWGLRKRFDTAREVLARVAPEVPGAPAEVQVRYWLELGRTWASPAHPPDQRDAASRERARPAYLRALDLARAAGLDVLAVDALHMMVMVDTSPQEQLAWNERAVAYMEASPDPRTQRWAGALYNNIGYAHELAGRHDEAIENYRKSMAAHEQAGQPARVRIAWWMIAHALRGQDRFMDALAIQERLEREWEAAGAPDPYVYEELELLHRNLGDPAQAQRYAAKLKAARAGS